MFQNSFQLYVVECSDSLRFASSCAIADAERTVFQVAISMKSQVIYIAELKLNSCDFLAKCKSGYVSGIQILDRYMVSMKCTRQSIYRKCYISQR
jgi:hypothetical protein